MLDIKFLRDDPAAAKARLAHKGVVPDAVDAILSLDEKRRQIGARADDLKSQRNTRSKNIGKVVKEGGNAEAEKAAVRELGDVIARLDAELQAVEAEQQAKLMWLPNYPDPASPVGGESANKVVRDWGVKPEFSFAPKPQKELGESLGIMDFARSAKLSGAGFSLLLGRGAALQRGLIRWLIDLHVAEHGYREVYPPFMVNTPTITGTGQLPKMADDMYKTTGEGDDLWLIPTAEVPVTNFFRDEILRPDQVPTNFVAYTPCFRREAGSHGKDTTGLMRLHQFDKVEMVKFVAPETSPDEHLKLLDNAEDCLRRLGLHYRVLELATGDTSFAAARCFDLEVWAPGTGRYLEVSSCSNFGDFQARRANIRFRRTADAKPEFVHTLNASGLALPRLMIALLETYQQADGSILLPEAIRATVGFDRIVPGS